MGSMEFKNETIDLGSQMDWEVGRTYRIGLWVNSNEAFEENRENNAYLFEKPLIYKAKQNSSKPEPSKVTPDENSENESDDADSEGESDQESFDF